MALQIAFFRFYTDLNDFLPPTKQQIPFAYPSSCRRQSVHALRGSKQRANGSLEP